MPLYEYICPKHGRFSEFADVADYQKPCNCPHSDCAHPSSRIISRLQRPIIYAVGGPRQRARENAAAGRIELGNESVDTIHREFNRYAEEAEAKRDAELMRAADEVAAELGSDVCNAIVKECFDGE